MKIASNFNRYCDELTWSFKEHARLVSLNRTTAEDLYGEMQGMYYRSGIPPFDIPQKTANMSESLDEKV